MAEYERNESVKEIAGLCERYFEFIESGVSLESIAKRFRTEFEPLAVRKIQEEPDNAFLTAFLAVGYHFFCNEDERRFELAEHYYSEAIKLEKQYTATVYAPDFVTCGEPGLAFLYWQYGRLDEARKIWDQFDSKQYEYGMGGLCGVAEWWWRDVVMLPMMFEDVVPKRDISDAFEGFALAPWSYEEEWPYQQFVLMLHSFNLMQDRWNDYDYDYRSSFLKNLILTYIQHLDRDSHGFKGSHPEFVAQQVEILEKRIDKLESDYETLDGLSEQFEGMTARILVQALARTKYQLGLAREEYEFLAEKQEVRLLEIMLETAHTNPHLEKWYFDDFFYDWKEFRTLFSFRPSLLQERRILKALQGLHDLEMKGKIVGAIKDEFIAWISYYIGEISRQIGKNENAQRYLERAYEYLKNEDDVIRSYGRVLGLIGEPTEAVKILENISNPTEADRERCELLNARKGTTQIIHVNLFWPSQTVGSIGELLGRINVQIPKQLEADPAAQALHFEEESNRLFAQLKNATERFPRDYDFKRLECEAEFASVWVHFPKGLQEEIIETSLLFSDYLSRSGEVNCISGIVLLGTVCEHALKLSVFKFLAMYLEETRYSAPLKFYRSGKQKQCDKKGSWTDSLGNTLFVDMQEMLRMARDKNHPIGKFIEAKGVDRWMWSQRLPPLIDRIRLLRNEAAHKPDRRFSVAELNEARAILWTRGFLYEVGEVLRLCADGRS